MNIKDLEALNLAQPTRENLLPSPQAILILDNRLFMNDISFSSISYYSNVRLISKIELE